MKEEATRTLLFGLFVVAARPLTAAQTVALAKPLRISASNVKSHLTRMVAGGVLLRSGPVRLAKYTPSRRQTNVIQGILSRMEETPAVPWDRTWFMLTLQMSRRRSDRDHVRALLLFDGFRPLSQHTFVRPAWPEDWALDRVQRFLQLARGVCVRGALTPSSTPGDLAAMYDLNRLDRAANHLARKLRNWRFPANSPASAFAARLRAGGMFAHLIRHDPRLPAAIWRGRNGIRNLVRAYKQFEARISPLADVFLHTVMAKDVRT
jgi:DNA-binding transcriptional regulator PaaX